VHDEKGMMLSLDFTFQASQPTPLFLVESHYFVNGFSSTKQSSLSYYRTIEHY